MYLRRRAVGRGMTWSDARDSMSHHQTSHAERLKGGRSAPPECPACWCLDKRLHWGPLNGTMQLPPRAEIDPSANQVFFSVEPSRHQQDRIGIMQWKTVEDRYKWTWTGARSNRCDAVEDRHQLT